MKAINALNLPTHNQLDEDGIREIMPYYMVRTKEVSDTNVTIEYYHHDTGLIRQIDIDCYSSLEDTPWVVRNWVNKANGRSQETEFYYACVASSYPVSALWVPSVLTIRRQLPSSPILSSTSSMTTSYTYTER